MKPSRVLTGKAGHRLQNDVPTTHLLLRWQDTPNPFETEELFYLASRRTEP